MIDNKSEQTVQLHRLVSIMIIGLQQNHVYLQYGSVIHVHLVFIDVCIYKYDYVYAPFVIYSKYVLVHSKNEINILVQK